MYDDNGRTTKATVDIAMDCRDGRTDGYATESKKAKRGNRNVELPKIKCMRVSVQRGSLSEAESEEKSCVECVLE